MPSADSALDSDQIARARSLLVRPAPSDSSWPALAAAALLAISAIGFATAMVLAPPLVKEHIAPQRSAR